ncbi:uncharacterized protein LOC114258030 [Camellia sinensis]|uniref:uncharacterized protein LOC114258030 n=1 Tax=Camellia sinensis TaxID=4442 RepID=UPI001036C43C|nr:uncharacterized protein LOC114258030 [Camellia sinensis]
MANNSTMPNLENSVKSSTLDHASLPRAILWAYWATAQTPIGETHFRLTYEAKAVIPVKIDLLTPRVLHSNAELNKELRWADLDLIKELREATTVRQASYQQKMRTHYNRKVRSREFAVGDLVSD